MSTVILNEMKVYIHKQMMSIKSRHLLLLFYKISILIYAFLLVLQNLKDASVTEVHSSSLQPALNSFLDCLISLVEVTTQVIFQGPKQVVVWRGQIRTVGWMGEQFPVILCSSVPAGKWGTQWEQTFWNSIISIISWTAWCPTPSCAATSLTVIL
jgi:hypothetical protein